MDCCIVLDLSSGGSFARKCPIATGLRALRLAAASWERPTATPVAIPPITKHPPALPQAFFARPAELVAPYLIGCLLVKRQEDGSLLWGVVVETEAYCQSEPACHGYRRRSPSNETLFGEPGRFYVCVSYGIRHCLKSPLT